MGSNTPHFGLLELVAGDSFAENNYQFSSEDRVTIDRLLYSGALGHHHNGAIATSNNPTSGPGLTVDNTTGNLPAGQQINYVYTYVDPTGAETLPSPTSFVTLPSPILTPSAASGVASSASGTLPVGGYFYAISAYTGSNTAETAASVPCYVQVTAIGEVILTLPSLPSGATGFNIYRQAPNDVQFFYLSSTSSSTFTDNGSLAEDCNRAAPNQNTTQSTNSVTITVTAPPSGWTWNLYRVITPGGPPTSWATSFLASVTTLDGSGNLILTFTDSGLVTGNGNPPSTSQLIGSPTKVLLTGGAEVQGLLPGSMIAFGNAFPFAVTFSVPGAVTDATGVLVWVCPFASVTIVSAICSLGRGSVPASQPVIADVLKGSGVNPTYTSIYSGVTPNPKPQIPVGQQVGTAAPPNITTLAAGDTLSVDVDQSGGGATPTDHDLTVTVYLQVGSTTSPQAPLWNFVDISAVSATLSAGEWAIGSPPSNTAVLYLPASPSPSQAPCRVEIANNNAQTASYTIQTTDGLSIVYAGSTYSGSGGLQLAEEGEIRDFTFDGTNNVWRVS